MEIVVPCAKPEQGTAVGSRRTHLVLRTGGTAGIGIGMIGGKALEAMARQPEHSGAIQTNMIIAAALVEGVALFGVVVALLK